MTLTLSARATALKPSATLGMKAKAKELSSRGVDVVDLTAGEPDFGAPAPVIARAHAALDEGVDHYTPVKGTPALLSAVRTHLKDTRGLDYAADEVLHSVGAKAVLAMAVDALVDPGDEVVIFAPYWVSYPAQIGLAGGVVKVVPTTADNGYVPTLDAIDAVLSDKTKLVIVNSPSNPTGAVWDKDTLFGLMQRLEGTNTWVIADEIYEHLVYDGATHVSPACASADAKARTLVVTGVSKGYAMTGWRVGVAAGPAALIGAMARLQGQRMTASAAIAQAAAAEALAEGPGVKAAIDTMRAAYKERRDHVVARLSAMPGVKVNTPAGTFYTMVDLSAFVGKAHKGAPVPTDVDLAYRLLEEAHVALVPGSPFGAPGRMRLSFASDLTRINEGLDRLEAWLAG